MPASLRALLEKIEREDPDLLAAADEVDGDLLDWFLSLRPDERLDRAARMARDYRELADAPRTR